MLVGRKSPPPPPPPPPRVCANSVSVFVSFFGRLAWPFKTKVDSLDSCQQCADSDGRAYFFEFHTFFTQSGALSPKLVRPITGVANCRPALDQGRVRAGGTPSVQLRGMGS